MPPTGRPKLASQQLCRHALFTHLTEEEYLPLVADFERSTFKHMSHYVRARLLSTPVTVLTRDATLDALVQQIKQLKSEMNAIGKNFNQLVLRHATARTGPEFAQTMAEIQRTQDGYIDACKRLQPLFDEIAAQWLRA